MDKTVESQRVRDSACLAFILLPRAVPALSAPEMPPMEMEMGWQGVLGYLFHLGSWAQPGWARIPVPEGSEKSLPDA